MSNLNAFTPAKFLAEFRRESEPFGYKFGYKALEKFKVIPDKSIFLEPIIAFINEEKKDRIRSWGITALGYFQGSERKRALRVLVQLFEKENTRDKKQLFWYTRFFALKGIYLLAKSEKEIATLNRLAESIWNDKDEGWYAQAGASILVARNPKAEINMKKSAEEKVLDMLKGKHFQEKDSARPILRALVEFPLPSICDELIKFMENTGNDYEKGWAITALAGYPNDLRVVNALADVYRRCNEDGLRLVSIDSLGQLKNADALDIFINALNDDNAQIRVVSSKALQSLVGQEEAAKIILQELLQGDREEAEINNFLEAIRRVDPDRQFSIGILSKELDSENQTRAKLARTILTSLGGWSALRRGTLDSLDRVLRSSEEGVNVLFNDTTRQARRNFYFAMAINAIIVFVGLSLITFAMMQLGGNPEKFETWIVPGAGGVFGVIITMYFNGPRKNAQKDLATLLKANVIYIGFLRRLTEIDAAFKHLYIENESFRIADMQTTVKEIESAISSTVKTIDQIATDKEGSATNSKTSS